MALDSPLDPLEARLFGVLIEKSLTTPDQYPLSVNAATNGANQKANRDPVLTLEMPDVEDALERLVRRALARKVYPGNSRVEKFCHSGKDALGLDAAGLAVIAELLMRGPQSPGELRVRAGRMVSIESLDRLATILSMLIDRSFVRRLAPLPGSRAERYVQLLSPDLHPLDPSPGAYAAAALAPSADNDLAARVTALEAEVQRLRAAVEQLASERKGSAAP
ncbi:YceH family protein [Candidatus Binatia bacterium]|nr:YceH family protein [Candidatus Binatia bacterium]